MTFRRSSLLPAIRFLLLVLPLALVKAEPSDVRPIAKALRSKDYSRAMALIEPELRKSPNDHQLLTLAAMAHAGSEKPREALANLENALKAAPDYVPALQLAAQIRYAAGDQAAAVPLDRLVKLDPADQTAHAMRAMLAWKKRDCVVAVEHFAQASSAISGQPAALHGYAGCLVAVNRPESALPVAEQLVALRRSDPFALRLLAVIQIEAGKPRAAVDTLTPLVQSGNVEAAQLASEAYEAAGDTAAAVQMLRAAIVRSPDRTDLYVDFAGVAMDHKSFETGVAMVNAGLTRLPKSAELYLTRGVLLTQLARHEEAAADFERADELNPGEVGSSIASAMSHLQRNNFDIALSTVRTQLKERPRDEFLCYMLAEILITNGASVGAPEFTEALNAAKRSVEIQPKFALGHNVLSRIYIQAGDTEKAIAESRSVLEFDSSDATALYRLAQLLRKRGRPGDQPEVRTLLERFVVARDQARAKEAQQKRYKLLIGEEASNRSPAR